ncbi:PadR family transcriptional regulator [Bifidobacterium catulorum]|uniref:PadR family transcriptional regulator n=1 Tax=Bifidobacterium catulorum TaxID=1630173 RepID=A0A2U2MSS1_9BIFI|nr:helix-turn-helix transcriptional regulator [Bifidobacterium catulorum]PWG59900.1 PadR family transcriptional regulator [Bifidobacterium catulorum]
MNVVEIMTLGFLSEGPLCGYRLRKKMTQLYGYARAFSDGTLHSVTGRFVKAGYLRESFDVVNGRCLRIFHLEPAGRERLVDELRNTHGYMLADITKWSIVMSFLSVVPDEDDRRTVLQRRLDLVNSDMRNLYGNGEGPLGNDRLTDRYRRAIMRIHDAEIASEREWLMGELGRGVIGRARPACNPPGCRHRSSSAARPRTVAAESDWRLPPDCR